MEEFINHLMPFLEKIQPIDIKPTGAKARFQKSNDIKALIFDIYGTLIISASGDIMQSTYNANMFKEALLQSGYQIRVPISELMAIHSIFKNEVGIAKQKAIDGGTPFPELNIVEVWEKTLARAEGNGLISSENAIDIKLFVFIFELQSNRVWPMPGMMDLLNGLRSKGYPLGIVSNAQFYTPVIMNYFMSKEVKEDEFLDGFEKDLSVFSYKMLKGKPDTAVYEALLEPLKKRGLKPEQVLFVGNDMLKDIYASSRVGFKTCFYAGDQRAYRIREDHPEASKIKPDFVITELKQLLEIV